MTFNMLERALKNLIEGSIKALAAEGVTPGIFQGDHITEIALDAPRDKAHGDIATNAALRLARRVKKAPMEYASLLAKEINKNLEHSKLRSEIGKAEAMQPGFINFWFSENKLSEILEEISTRKSRYGSAVSGLRTKVNIEFVSANPTGPLTIAHGRQAAFGDTLANILEFANYRVTREYYLNDEGNQIGLLAMSVRAEYLKLFSMPSQLPESGYKGLYIRDIARDIKSKYGSRFLNNEHLNFFSDFSCKWIVGNIKKDLKDFNVDFDIWYSQKKLNSSGKIKRALKFLSRKNLIYEKDNATWFRSSKFGDGKDRVVIKSSGEYTYLAPDIAYHMYKFKRGFDRVIDIWGPDHHGYVPRIKAAVRALGRKEGSLETLIVQLSTLFKNGKAIQMSTRAGEFITLRELLMDVGGDAARFFFLRRKRDSHLDFDLALAKKHSMDNPVYYIQYAHARICSLYKYKGQKKNKYGRISLRKKQCWGPDELNIIKLLGRFTLIIELCAKKLEVFPLISYLEEAASAFHSYYDKYRIITKDKGLTVSRLSLCLAIRTVLANGLRLLGVKSPEKM